MKRAAQLKLSPTKFIIGERLSYLADGVLVLEIEPVVSIPHEYFLSATYPNPFNSSARIDYGLPEAGFLSIKVYDIAGRIVFTLFDGRTAAFRSLGRYSQRLRSVFHTHESSRIQLTRKAVTRQVMIPYLKVITVSIVMMRFGSPPW